MLYEVEHHIVHNFTVNPLEKNTVKIPYYAKRCMQYFLSKMRYSKRYNFMAHFFSPLAFCLQKLGEVPKHKSAWK